jgi:hypothetical protein
MIFLNEFFAVSEIKARKDLIKVLLLLILNARTAVALITNSPTPIHLELPLESL